MRSRIIDRISETETLLNIADICSKVEPFKNPTEKGLCNYNHAGRMRRNLVINH